VCHSLTHPRPADCALIEPEHHGQLIEVPKYWLARTEPLDPQDNIEAINRNHVAIYGECLESMQTGSLGQTPLQVTYSPLATLLKARGTPPPID
jgi:hypothetical protein